jgi:hypothetical protein
MRGLRLERAAPDEAAWMRELLGRLGTPFGARVQLDPEGRLALARGP